MVGDDEHGWDDDGVFNLEGVCDAFSIETLEELTSFVNRAVMQRP